MTLCGKRRQQYPELFNIPSQTAQKAPGEAIGEEAGKEYQSTMSPLQCGFEKLVFGQVVPFLTSGIEPSRGTRGE